ncbi:haloacid dehalogenase-like hydrolase domain-containing protein 2 [Crucibulum laeve]|uniref:Haloacid dehalogenase-like hydrolase domain-containing protein 2 n=1 Tax=Crucibulum laeve TaxID=68775 RepID=A0A5C3M018_9AGAR|nr:haloacid dehalogenase-like hydrolase domain-containing protein 2 [Crucibulum laeve]
MSNPRTRPFIRALLIDVSGNLHVGSTATPNAVEAFERLKSANIPFRFCSNTSKESTTSLVKRLHSLGFYLPDKSNSDEPGNLVWTSIGAVKQVLKDMNLKRPYLLLSDSAREEFFAASESQEQATDSQGIYDSVVVGLAPDSFKYEYLNTAFRILMREEPREEGDSEMSSKDLAARSPIPLIATHKAKYIQTESPKGLSLGPGPFVTALENASGKKAHVVGKPTKTFFQSVINDFYASGDLSKNSEGRIAIIGDDVESDLGNGAVELGLWRILVKTGKYRDGDENKPGVVPPNEVFNSFATFVDKLLLEQE